MKQVSMKSIHHQRGFAEILVLSLFMGLVWIGILMLQAEHKIDVKNNQSDIPVTDTRGVGSFGDRDNNVLIFESYEIAVGSETPPFTPSQKLVVKTFKPEGFLSQFMPSGDYLCSENRCLRVLEMVSTEA